jgi:hypothetical protein
LAKSLLEASGNYGLKAFRKQYVRDYGVKAFRKQ